jgi:hypothetical protein
LAAPEIVEDLLMPFRNSRRRTKVAARVGADGVEPGDTGTETAEGEADQ